METSEKAITQIYYEDSWLQSPMTKLTKLLNCKLNRAPQNFSDLDRNSTEYG
jgi:hypothetical protein